MKKKMGAIALGCYLIDLFVKVILTRTGVVFYKIPVIKDFFNITYTRNYGAGFGIMQNQTAILVIIAIVVVIAIFKICLPQINNKLKIWGYGLLLGGIFGNLIERIVHGFVTDYFQFVFFKYSFPIFNLADAFICIGVIIIIIEAIRSEKNEVNGKRKHKGKN